jgi:hypothetical protein
MTQSVKLKIFQVQGALTFHLPLCSVRGRGVGKGLCERLLSPFGQQIPAQFPQHVVRCHVSPSAAAVQQSLQPGLPALETRRHLRDRIPIQTFRVAGVSFEGRQDLLREMEPGVTSWAFGPKSCMPLLGPTDPFIYPRQRSTRYQRDPGSPTRDWQPHHLSFGKIRTYLSFSVPSHAFGRFFRWF